MVYDERFKDLRQGNLTGAVPLAKWPGMAPKNGGGYVYALDDMRLYAQPTLPTGSELLVAPSDGKDFAAYFLKVKAAQDEVGPFKEFHLDGI